MDVLVILRTLAAVTTVLAAALVAANLNARVTVIGFVIFIVACIAWMIDGWIESKASLVIQNVILLFINVIGVWRWYPRAEKEAKGYRSCNLVAKFVAAAPLLQWRAEYLMGF
jgi:hypothetical protein